MWEKPREPRNWNGAVANEKSRPRRRITPLGTCGMREGKAGHRANSGAKNSEVTACLSRICEGGPPGLQSFPGKSQPGSRELFQGYSAGWFLWRESIIPGRDVIPIDQVDFPEEASSLRLKARMFLPVISMVIVHNTFIAIYIMP